MVRDKSLTNKRHGATIRGMDDLTLGIMVLARMQELGLDLESASALTGISERHLRRIIEDAGFTPQEGTQAKLEALGLSRESIVLGATRSKMKVLQSRLVPA